MKAASKLTPVEINRIRAENRDLRQHAEDLERVTRQFLRRMDDLLTHPETFNARSGRGREAARLMNALNWELDRMAYLGLDKPLPGHSARPAPAADGEGVAP